LTVSRNGAKIEAVDALTTAIGHVVAGASRWRVTAALGPTDRGAAFRVESLESGGDQARLDLWEPSHIAERGVLAQLEREARVVARFRHERCLTLLDFGTDEGRPFVVSELPPGQPIAAELGPDLSVARAVTLASQVLEGLRHLHGHGLLHRAISAENVWVDRSLSGDTVKLGLPRVGRPPGLATTAGRDPYDPPERSPGRSDATRDLYAAGMLLYAMCTGGPPPPVPPGSPSGSVPAARAGAPDRGISEELERVIQRALARSPEARYQSADDLLVALQALRARYAAPRPPPPARHSRAVLVVAGVVVAGALGAPVLRGRHRTGSTGAEVAVRAAGGGRAVEGSGGPSPSASPAGPQPRRQAGGAGAGGGAAPRAVPTAPPATSAEPAPEPPVLRRPAGGPPAASGEPAPPPPVPARSPQRGQGAPPASTASGPPPPGPRHVEGGDGEVRARAASTGPTSPPPGRPRAADTAVSGPAPTTDDEQKEIWALIDAGRLHKAGNQIAPLVARDPAAAWPRFALAVLYYHRLWRRDALRHWEVAFAADPTLLHDPHFTGVLCSMLDPNWQAVGLTPFLDGLGEAVVPLVSGCVTEATDPQRRSRAAYALQRLRASRDRPSR
jgi:hypothetical protein